MSKILRDDIEYIVHCDEKGCVIGPISKVHAHLAGVRATLFHYVTWSMVYNPLLQKYGVQLKNPKKNDSSQGGVRDMGVAGHNCYILDRYLDFNENLQKEAEEEIDIKISMLNNINTFIDKYKSLKEGSIGYIFETFAYNTPSNKEWVGLGFIATCETNLSFNDGEVVDFSRYSPNELSKFIKENNKQCASALQVAFEKAEKFRREILI